MSAEVIVQAISGGMDSTALALRHLSVGREVHLISFDYGQKHSLELVRLDSLLEYLNSRGIYPAHTRIEVPFGLLAASALTDDNQPPPQGHFAEESMKQTVVPNRNAIFSALCFAHALTLANKEGCPVDVSLGVHSGDHGIYPDCRLPFFEALHAAFVLGSWGGELVGLDLPFLAFDKSDILRDLLNSCSMLGLNFDEVMSNTSTSYAPTSDGLANGYTGSDVERILAFHALGRVDPVGYVDGWETVLESALRAQAEWDAANLID